MRFPERSTAPKAARKIRTASAQCASITARSGTAWSPSSIARFTGSPITSQFKNVADALRVRRDEPALLGQPRDVAGQGVHGSGRTVLPQHPGQLGEPRLLPDHQPPQPQDPRLHHRRQLAYGVVGQRHFQVGRRGRIGQLVGVHAVAGPARHALDQLDEQRLLAAEVGVHGLLRDPRQGGELVHVGAEIAVAEEHLLGSSDDRRAFAQRARSQPVRHREPPR